MSDIKKELKELEEIMHSTDEDREQKFEKKFLYIRNSSERYMKQVLFPLRF